MRFQIHGCGPRLIDRRMRVLCPREGAEGVKDALHAPSHLGTRGQGQSIFQWPHALSYLPEARRVV